VIPSTLLAIKPTIAIVLHARAESRYDYAVITLNFLPVFCFELLNSVKKQAFLLNSVKILIKLSIGLINKSIFAPYRTY
jgi:hypothetical protein